MRNDGLAGWAAAGADRCRCCPPASGQLGGPNDLDIERPAVELPLDVALSVSWSGAAAVERPLWVPSHARDQASRKLRTKETDIGNGLEDGANDFVTREAEACPVNRKDDYFGLHHGRKLLGESGGFIWGRGSGQAAWCGKTSV